LIKEKGGNIMKKLLFLVLAVSLMILLPTKSTASAAETSLPNPTYKVTVNAKGDITVTFQHVNKKAKIYYSTDHRPTIKDKYVVGSGKITFNYADNYRLHLRVYTAKNSSCWVDIDGLSAFEKRYDKELKSFLANLTKDCKTDEDKLVQLWKWIMCNTQYAYTSKHKPDGSCSGSEDVFFQHKATCAGFAHFWQDSCDILGIETKILAKPNHLYNITKVNGDWYFVDTTHVGLYELDDPTFYDRFLDNASVNFTTNLDGYDLSSTHYDVFLGNGNTAIYFSLLDYVATGDGWFTYDAVADRYTLHDIYEED
jgi:transglutaminase/protease-like cytokinesis protein 3